MHSTKTCNNHLFHARIETKGDCEKIDKKGGLPVAKVCGLPGQCLVLEHWVGPNFKAVHHTPTMTLL
jgi:hypothetical protein